jgi:hypothetical protein
VRVAAAAFVAAAIFLGGVMVGLGSSDDGDREAPVAIALVDEGTTATPRAQEESNVKRVEHPAKQGEVDDNSGPGGGEAEYWEEDNSGPGSDDDTAGDSSGPGSGDDSSGPGSGGDDSSGSGSGGDDNSGSGSSSSGSGSDGSGESSGPG